MNLLLINTRAGKLAAKWVCWLGLLLCFPVWLLALESNVVISVYQGASQEGDFAANLTTTRKVIAEARKRGSQFVAFPEGFLSGYESRAAVARGARSLDDEELKTFIAESAAHDVVVIVGLARNSPEGLFNTALVIHRGRLLGYYDKVMLTTGDRQSLSFTAGSSVPVFQAHGVRFAVILCHDSSVPQVALAARLQGAEILFTPHHNEILAAAVDEHRRWVRNCHFGLASQLKMVVACANSVKPARAEKNGYSDSFILSPQGTPLAETKRSKSQLLTATITPAMFQSPQVWADLNETPTWLRTQLGQLLMDFRRPANDADLRAWLENMVVFHRFAPAEVSAATGLTMDEINVALRKFDLAGKTAPARQPTEPLRVLPYPGGRHPRLGFFEGELMPQRETKLSVFTPWDDQSYVVVDVPEAIFSNLGLTYLAHTHIPTVWDLQGITLPRLEWQRRIEGGLTVERLLPNGLGFGATAVATPNEVRLELWLRNGTSEMLRELRVQNCVMLGAARGFTAQTETNKVFQSPYAAARSEDGRRWIITAWEPVQRCWGNPLCPCLHSDPQFPDCAPGETVRVRGWLSFYEGADIHDEFKRIEQTGWQK